MTPYYDRDGVTIYHADCRDILPSIDPTSVDLLLTDPPYGMALDTDYGKPGKHKNGGLRWPSVAGDAEPFDPTPLLAFARSVLWGANYYADRLPNRGSWLVWHKNIRSGHPDRGEAELAWTTAYNGPVRHVTVPWDVGDRPSAEPFSAYVHPTQKPVALMRWILDRWTKPGDLILDPYMGSGPVARAAQLLGRRYIGIELVEDYCKAAVNRLAQPSMFAEDAA